MVIITGIYVIATIIIYWANIKSENASKEQLEEMQKQYAVGVGQHYDLFIGGNKLRGNPNMTPLTGTIKYEAQGKEYEGDLFVDLEHYMTFFSATTDEKIVAVRIVQEHQMLFENAQQTYDVW